MTEHDGDNDADDDEFPFVDPVLSERWGRQGKNKQHKMISMQF